MPTLEQVKAQVDFLLSKGRGQEKAHLVLVEQEARERIANVGPKRKTRLVRELDSPEAYSEFNREFDRFIATAENKQIALDAMLEALRSWDEERIKIFREGEEAFR